MAKSDALKDGVGKIHCQPTKLHYSIYYKAFPLTILSNLRETQAATTQRGSIDE